MMQCFSVKVPSTLEGMAQATSATEEWLRVYTQDQGALHWVALAIEEVMTNCIKYGYDDTNLHWIDVGLVLEREKLSILIQDDGHPFNPLKLDAPDRTSSVEGREVGGMGIYLLRQLSDEMQYERTNDKNCLTLQKRIQLARTNDNVAS